jgi:stress response protein YsnF
VSEESDTADPAIGDATVESRWRPGDVHVKGDELEIPLYEEVLVKRTILREIVRVRKNVVTERRNVEADVRKEDVVETRRDAADLREERARERTDPPSWDVQGRV